VTHYLGGENYVFWGGREGYQSLLNTDMERELNHMVCESFLLWINNFTLLPSFISCITEQYIRSLLEINET